MGAPWCCFAPWRWWSCTLPCTSLVTLPADIGPGRDHTGTAGLVLDEADCFYSDNLPTNITFTLTVDGAEQPHGTSATPAATTWPAVP